MKKFICSFVILVLTLTICPGYAEPPVNQANNTVIVSSVNYSKDINNLVGHFDNKIKIVFSDIDGTLVPLDKNNPRGKAPEKIKQAVKVLKQAKIPLVLVTGRSYIEAKEIAKSMDNENTYIITQQGAIITSPEGKIIYQDKINSEDTRKILKFISSFLNSNHLNSKIFFLANGKFYTTEEFERPYNWEPVTIVKSINDLNSNFSAYQIGIYDTNRQNLKLLQSQLKKEFPKYNIDISTDCYCDVSSTKSTKGNAIEKLSKILNVDLKNAAVFGDAENDISMLKLVKSKGGIAIAVGNALDSVKENANYVTLSVYEGGFNKAITKIIENNSKLKD